MRNKFFKRLHRRILVGCVAFLFVLLAASLSWASTIYYTHGVSVAGISATVEMKKDAGTSIIEFWVENTSSVDPSYITGFVFNVPSIVTGIGDFEALDDGGISRAGSSPEWHKLASLNLLTEKALNTPGSYGYFDVAAATGSKSINGGKILWGIEPGEEFYFAFTLLGNSGDISDLTDSDFNILSDLMGKPGDPQPILVRFQGIGPNDLSDVAIVPIPSAILLLGSGLLSLVGIRKKFSS